jgi:hypothetical protein
MSAAESAAGVTIENYFADWLDVRRYGAVGNGVVDDTLAIQHFESCTNFTSGNSTRAAVVGASILAGATSYGGTYDPPSVVGYL